MKRIFPLFIIFIAFCLGCGEPGKSNAYYEGYDEGYDNGYKAGYQQAYDNMLPYEDAIEYIKENYSIDDIYESSEICEYVTDRYAPNELYDNDTLINCLTEVDYVVSEAPKKELFYIGNMNTHVYHRPKCKSILKMNPHNIKRASKEELENRGYRPCKNCKP